MGFRTVRTAVIEFTCERCDATATAEQPPTNDAPMPRYTEAQWPKGWSECTLRCDTPRPLGRIYTLLCATCTAALIGFLKCENDDEWIEPDAPDDDDGPESVPEGAEGRGPGWSVRMGDDDGTRATGKGADSYIEVPPSAPDLVGASLRVLSALHGGAPLEVTIIGAPGAGGGASGGGGAGAAGTGGFEYTTGRGGGAADPGGGTTRGAGGPMFMRRRSDACKRCAHTLEQHEAPGSECVVADCGCRWFVDAFEAVQ